MRSDDKRPETGTDCTRCSPGIRSHYFRGKLLTVADYEGEQRYMNGRRRLINRAMLGHGVIAGLAVRGGGGDPLTIGPGLALDSVGRELLACRTVTLRRPGDLLWLEKPGSCWTIGGPPRPEQADRGQVTQADLDQEPAPTPLLYLLAAHYAERRIDPVAVGDGCGEERCEANRICETVVYSLSPIDDCTSGLADCRDDCWPDAGCSLLSFDEAAPLPPPEQPATVADRANRGPQATLCRWSDGWLSQDGFDPCDAAELPRPNGCDVALDADAGVALACVEVTFDHCGDAVVSRIVDSCRPRRLMRPNDLLFDLIRGCDLTVIQDIGWRNWHRLQGEAVPRHSFETMFLPPAQTEFVQTNFWVCLSGPVKVESLTPDVFTITLIRSDEDEDVSQVLRVPVVGISVDPEYLDDPAGTTRRFAPVVSYEFYHGEIGPNKKSGFRCRNQVEIEIDGDRIIAADCQPIDGNTRGLDLPSGNGTPGGRFRSVFTVEPRGDEQISPHPDVALPASDESTGTGE